MTDEVTPRGAALAFKNRRVLAERTGWPEGALETCERTEQSYPNYYVNWHDANTWARSPAGFYAQYRNEWGGYDKPLYGEDELAIFRTIDKDQTERTQAEKLKKAKQQNFLR
jgi:hypothetical protein